MEKIKAFGICLYKRSNDTIEVLLCKSVNSNEKWGFLKGVTLKNETSEETAMREFLEESSIKVEQDKLEKFFFQENDLKDIGIYLVNYHNLKDVESYFNDGKLYEKYLCKENSEVKFFDINNLPIIKKKQVFLSNDIIKYLNSM